MRHYGQLGLLPPSRIGVNGYRYYDERSLVAFAERRRETGVPAGPARYRRGLRAGA
ncbi:MerR family transcriptional regulator [Nocardia sp. NPDC004568]|uniref:MerR family transcriptional regulator n=1 Tax=Nocardia sp. NPDC004568 TaxID=3154551 RepID=UPI0033AB84AF